MSALGTRLRQPPHRRRVRGSSRGRWSRRALWLAIGCTAALVAGTGAVVGAFVLGTFASVPNQSSASGIPNPPPGVSYVLANAEIVGPSTVPASGACITSNLGNVSVPTSLSNGNTTGICLTTAVAGYGTGDTMYVLEVSWNATAAVSTTFEAQIAVDVSPSAHDVVVTAYLKTSSTITVSESAAFAVDLSAAGDTGVTQFSILITQL